MAADGVCDHLRVELARVVKAGRVDCNQFRHCDECQIDRRSTGRAEGVDLFIPAVARYPPGVRFARNCHIGSLGEGQIGSMPRATSFLAIAALAVVLEDGFAARFIANRAARASAGIGLGQGNDGPVKQAFNLSDREPAACIGICRYICLSSFAELFVRGLGERDRQPWLPMLS
jgi:hypothetical protein